MIDEAIRKREYSLNRALEEWKATCGETEEEYERNYDEVRSRYFEACDRAWEEFMATTGKTAEQAFADEWISCLLL